METIDFYPKTFCQIPDQDNPINSDTECMLIVAEEDSMLKAPHAVVLRIATDPDDMVTNIAKFWRHETSVNYCNML